MTEQHSSESTNNNIYDTFKFDFLLDRIYNHLNNNNTKQKINLPKLQIGIENKKTYFSNYNVVCDELNRNPNDFIKFIQRELSTGTSINGNGDLVIDGVFREKQIEKIILNYIENFVKCKMCKSLLTQIIKEHRNFILSCNKCNATSTLHIDK